VGTKGKASARRGIAGATPEARRRFVEKGQANLARWKTDCVADAKAVRDMTAEFEKELRAEIGENPSAIASALAVSAVSSYGTIALVSQKIKKRKGWAAVSTA